MCLKHVGVRRWLIGCAAIGVVAFSSHSDCFFVGEIFVGSTAFAEDIVAEAAAVRQQLVDDIGAVESAALRARLLDSARANAVGSALEHWYSGEILADGQWLTLDEANQQAAEDEELAAYRDLRAQLSDTVGGHEKIARWCQKKQLPELANMHWLHVLRIQPKHNTALKMLNLRWYRGRLLAEEEVAGYQESERKFLQEQKKWRTQAKRLRRDLEQGELQEQKAARKELWEIRDRAAVPALVKEFTEEGQEEQTTINRRTELVAALGNIDARAATEVLVRFAVESPRDSIRYAALDELKAKPYEKFVPILLSGLRLPVEGSVSIYQLGDQIVSSYSYVQEGHTGQEYLKESSSSYKIRGQRYDAAPITRTRLLHTHEGREAYTIPGKTIPAKTITGYWCHDHWVPLPRRDYPEKYIPSKYVPAIPESKHYETTRIGTAYSQNERPQFQQAKERLFERSEAKAAGMARRVERFNADIEQQNAQIADVLSEITGETLTVFPKSWWNWWSGYLDGHPELETSGVRQRWNRALLNKEPRGLSRGTWVWTRRGRVAVETILPGDFVLAQHPQTGELAYKVVLAIVPPRQLAISKIELERGALHCAAGHVVWTSGHGWQRVSKLAAGESLHGVSDEVRVGQIDKEFTIDSYDLIVDGFHTLFVGESGVLVHDATPIAAAYVALPGFSPAEVAGAVR